MPSNKNDLPLSPRERRLLDALKGGKWVPSTVLMDLEFKGKKRPPNARGCITSALWKARQKLSEVKGAPRIETRGGGRGGTEYCLIRG